ncbi:dTDP-4-dehydrorhamnose reductase [Terrihabitans rhizophilus]|uniref:dTDP-4-dehydrorhamnose reductase n=1 Tax=Terrihabitans rhizophilus TaxID=3092662 RepID=A0ABU4RMH1_9HYPH|nr:dTDP-4-dehydrorhamnose reductase [Terrihabitans sp. PJ23]MDX6805781.1 dTDP-4-dehydrorhamnose reductase [Terrihabitans sp. PJ23]
MDVLVTGGAGQVGLELQRFAWPDGVHVHAPTRDELDLTRPDAIAAYVGARRWGAIINSAAYTAVDKAESDVAAAWAINALAPAALAHAAAQAGTPIIQVSTDYVFDGSKDGFYTEDDPVAPIGVYGASKEGGEQAVRTANPRHVIVRTAWVVSAHRANFVKTMLRVGADRPVLRVVGDQQGCPTSAADLAAALATIALRAAGDEAAPFGTYHFVNEGGTTWADFAREIFAQAAARGGPAPEVEQITTAEYPTPARRPANSRLSTDKIRDRFGVQPRPWKTALGDILAELMD